MNKFERRILLPALKGDLQAIARLSEKKLRGLFPLLATNGWPATATISSPGCTPAFAAGEPGSRFRLTLSVEPARFSVRFNVSPRGQKTI